MDDAFDKFRPLTDDECETASIAETPSDDGELVSPVPPDAPNVPNTHPRFGRPTQTYTYRDASGAVLSHNLRFDRPGERKQFVPLSLWRDAKGLRWRWKGFPAPRPLYGLDRLAANPDATAVVCEGEKAADAAARIFPDHVAVTSFGGANGAAKADWKPLAGRRVSIWPDADEPGAKFAAEVAHILHGLECEVSTIDATALASMTPDGGKREPIEGWDAADAVAEWQDLPALRKEAVKLAKPFDAGPAFVSHGPFTMTAEGLYSETTRGRSETRQTISKSVSAAFEIIGRSRNAVGGDWGLWLRWCDGDGRTHHRLVASAAIHGEPAALCQSLASEGLAIVREKQRALANYLCGADVRSRVTKADRTGWHSNGGRDVFVLPEETIGPRGVETVILDAAARGPYEVRGSLSDWQHGVGAMASGHALAVLAVSAALAGPLLHLAGQEGGGLNFFGPSSRGKTTLLHLAASVWGPPAYVRAWRATANGLEGAAASATDTALILDELGVLEARDAQAALYSLSNGAGKARAARDGSLREPKTWRVFILSSGEIPIETKLSEERGRRARAGQLVRMLDVPAERGFGFGVFDNAGPDGDAATLAKSFKQAATAAYGTAGPEFVRRLITEDVTGEDVRAMVAKFTASTVPNGADGQLDRAAQRFGLIAAAGELATALGLTPWRQNEAWEAAAWAFQQWLTHRGGTVPANPCKRFRKCGFSSNNMGRRGLIRSIIPTPSHHRTVPAGDAATGTCANGSSPQKYGRPKYAPGLIRHSSPAP